MKFECEAWVEIVPVMGDDGGINGARIAQMWQRPGEGRIQLSISVPESFFRTPEIRVSLKERDPEIWEGHEIEMSDSESRGAS